jgi:hypothetical protein
MVEVLSAEVVLGEEGTLAVGVMPTGEVVWSVPVPEEQPVNIAAAMTKTARKAKNRAGW